MLDVTGDHRSGEQSVGHKIKGLARGHIAELEDFPESKSDKGDEPGLPLFAQYRETNPPERSQENEDLDEVQQAQQRQSRVAVRRGRGDADQCLLRPLVEARRQREFGGDRRPGKGEGGRGICVGGVGFRAEHGVVRQI